MPNTVIKSFSQYLYIPENEDIMSIIKERIGNGDWYRAAGDCICSCGKHYSRHQNVEGAEWLTILCNGHLVKL